MFKRQRVIVFLFNCSVQMQGVKDIFQTNKKSQIKLTLAFFPSPSFSRYRLQFSLMAYILKGSTNPKLYLSILCMKYKLLLTKSEDLRKANQSIYILEGIAKILSSVLMEEMGVGSLSNKQNNKIQSEWT